MKAVVINDWCQPEDVKIGELPQPVLGAGQVRIRVRASSVNFADILMVQGKYQEKPPFPFSPGGEAAGDVLEVAEGVTHVKVGDRVAALCGHGGHAEQVVADAASVSLIPDGMDYVTAASFTITYGTSHIGLAHRGRLMAGETLLVHGAAGGVGLTAVEIGKLMGATVIATAGSDEKLALTRQYGADYTINYREQDFRSIVKEITNGKGADVIYDPVGGKVFDESLRCIAWEGRILVVGFASGRIPKAPANYLLVKNCSVVGLYWGAYARKDPKVWLDSMQQLYQWYGEGKLKPHISATLPLERAVDAMQLLIGRKSTGKVVLEIV
ncbi:MAG: NADPH:quinone oxidoreductase family protein [Candidatus Promineifilaceae bacterium]